MTIKTTNGNRAAIRLGDERMKPAQPVSEDCTLFAGYLIFALLGIQRSLCVVEDVAFVPYQH